MERDPLSFVRRRAFGSHAAAVLLLTAALPVLWIALDLVRVLLDAGLAPTDEPVRLMRWVLPLPERLAEGPLLLFAGFEVARADVPLVVSAALLLAILVLAGVAVGLAALRARIGTRAWRD